MLCITCTKEDSTGCRSNYVRLKTNLDKYATAYCSFKHAIIYGIRLPRAEAFIVSTVIAHLKTVFN